MYDYLRFYLEGLTPQICQDKCIEYWVGLEGISTYQSHYCYCWYDDKKLPSDLPSDVHGYSTRFTGAGEVTMTKNDDGDCYKFLENVVATETPTMMPTDQPSISPTPKPTSAPSKNPTQKPTEYTVSVSQHLRYCSACSVYECSNNTSFITEWRLYVHGEWLV